ncbi:helix-turn-helix domain-containing protein [Mycobacterium vicinigordonae]|uniref:Helix-turn-helix domain-containing protein n=1 Tax=Mycobacterium vicinigordonae TaxID=1719132 RepID=A0A7D6E6V0_9MYCO|nr:helix-turn-helix domain-containing protein [Mycobacterium vicinigordonae]QLL06505.1 helix-turn-helix domain-containing protein [Mycobacterium vicinigordonae]
MPPTSLQQDLVADVADHEMAPAAAPVQGLLRRLLVAPSVTAATQALVDTVHECFHCDVSWSGIVSEGFLMMAAYNGIRTPEMMALWRLEVGQGVGGRVAKQGRTISARDYRRDPRRVPVMKSVIDAEGVRSAICAPLLSGAEVLGVVYAACRRVRDWTEDEVALLTMMGRDTGVALARIAQHHSEQERAEQARRATTAAHDALQALRSIAEAVACSDDLGAGVDVLAHHLGMRVELLDQAGVQLLASPANVGTEAPIQWEDDLGGADLGTLRVRWSRGLRPSEIELAAVGAQIIGLQILRARAGLRAEIRLHSELLNDLLDGHVADLRAIRDRASLLGFDLAQPRHVACIGAHRGPNPREQHELGHGLAAAESVISSWFPNAFIVPRTDELVALIDSDSAPSHEIHAVLQQAVCDHRLAAPGLAAGVGRMCMGPSDYADSYADAALGLDVARRRARPGEVLSSADLGLYGLFGHGGSRKSLESMVERALGPLIEADADGGSAYVKSLHAYLICDRHLERAAAMLHIHPNTVRYRLTKIREILGVDLHDVEKRFLLELALRVQSVLGED